VAAPDGRLAPASAGGASGPANGTVLVSLDRSSLEVLRTSIIGAQKPKGFLDYIDDFAKALQFVVLVGGIGWGSYIYFRFDASHKQTEKQTDEMRLQNAEWIRLQVKSDVSIRRVEKSSLYHISFALHSSNASGIPVAITRNLVTLYAGDWAPDLEAQLADGGAVRIGAPPFEELAVRWYQMKSEPFMAEDRRGRNTGELGVGQETYSSYDYMAKLRPGQWFAIRSDLCVYPLGDADTIDQTHCPPAHNQIDYKYCLLQSRDVWSCENEPESYLDGGTK
jgi:hypothetical protein